MQGALLADLGQTSRLGLCMRLAAPAALRPMPGLPDGKLLDLLSWSFGNMATYLKSVCPDMKAALLTGGQSVSLHSWRLSPKV